MVALLVTALIAQVRGKIFTDLAGPVRGPETSSIAKLKFTLALLQPGWILWLAWFCNW
jgi:hypothetical protein